MELWRKTWYALPTFGDFLNASPFPSCAKEVLTPSKIQFADESAVISNGIISKSYPSALLLKNDMQALIRKLYSRTKLAGCVIEARQAITDVRPGVNHFALQIGNGDYDQIFAKSVILATGRSSAGSIGDLLRRTHARIKSQAPDLGIRLYMPYSMSDLFVNCGQDIKLKRHIADTTVRTFCVCTGGTSAHINIDNVTYTDGHFTEQVTKNVNFGIVARRSEVVGYHAARRFAVSMGEILAGKNLTILELMNRLPRLAHKVANGAFQGHLVATEPSYAV